MVNEHWPLFDLEIRTPALTLRYLDDELTADLLAVARRGVHDPAVMPFTIPWTDLPSPQMEQEAMRFYARTRADVRPAAWNLQFAVIVEDQPSDELLDEIRIVNLTSVSFNNEFEYLFDA